MSPAIGCQTWLASEISLLFGSDGSMVIHSFLQFIQSSDADVKLNVLRDFMVSLLTPLCSCSLSTEYIAQANLTCNEEDTMLFQGALVGTEEASGPKIHSQLQWWVDEGQKIEIVFMPLDLAKCLTYLGSEATCKIMNY